MKNWMIIPVLAFMSAGQAVVAGEVALAQISPVVSEAAQAQQPVSPAVGEAEETRLKNRVHARWQALAKGDFEAAYQFETPAYRAIYTPRHFQYQFGGQIVWRMANVKNIHYDDPSVARVEVEVAYLYGEPEKKDSPVLNTTSRISEVWLFKDGEWWRQQS